MALSAPDKSTIRCVMASTVENCLHLEGLRVVEGREFRCPVCEERLDLEGVARWVREAEMARDEGYSAVEGDEFAEIAREEWQREVYRRRKLLYDLQGASHVEDARPEMVLVVYDSGDDSYSCRVFYKEPRPASGLEELSVEAVMESILELRSDPDPIVRLAADKVRELHVLREESVKEGTPAPGRRVFYANEF